ncbi:Cytochrome P450 superfamily protein [Actinidia rufa]|uniref:Cytochrome P450 superfamily protein n=1 Tax=Actinidia rufa TaxID=165716 RepID=A0A7J0H1P4_9ERIC|nr:Cytochrome P450 superfamily protein [Actinidia rufa]
MMLVRNESNLPWSFFILAATPWRSSHSRAGIKSPMLNTPDSTISSTTICLNSSAFASPPPLPSPNTLRPSITRPSALVVHTFSSCPRFIVVSWPALTSARVSIAISSCAEWKRFGKDCGDT